MDMQIRRDDLTSPEIRALLLQHQQHMHSISPPESCHVLGMDGLRDVSVTFWSVWDGGELLGCGALKQLDARHGEIKSMRTVDAHRRKGVAQTMLTYIIEEAGRRAYSRLSLETGSQTEFVPAQQLYLRNGFAYCGPFADYIVDPNSVYMTREL